MLYRWLDALVFMHLCSTHRLHLRIFVDRRSVLFLSGTYNANFLLPLLSVSDK